MERIVRAWPCLASALLLLVAFPPFNLRILVFVALIPWLYSLSASTRRGAWKSGYVFGLLLGFGQLYWIGVLTFRWTQSPFLGVLPALLAALAFALYFGWAGVLIWKCFSRGQYWLIPVVWAGIEVFRSYIPVFAFPWGLIASPLWPYTSVVQSAYFGFIFLVSAWVVLFNVIATRLLQGATWKEAKPLAWAFATVLALSLTRFFSPVQTREVVATAVQPGVDMAFGNKSVEFVNLQKTVQPAIDQAARDGTDLIVLPEGVAEARHMPPITPFAPANVPTVVGARRGSNPQFQSALGFDGSTWKHVDKTRLVIFGEFVPGREQFPFLAQAFRLPSGDMSAGTEGVQSMRLNDMEVGPVICFEALFPDISFRQALNGAQVLPVISIDDWYMGTGAPEELAGASVWRSIETGLPVVRAASLGYTIVTTNKGRLVARAPLREPRSVRQPIAIPTTSTAFLGAPLFPLFALLAAIGVSFGWMKRSRE